MSFLRLSIDANAGERVARRLLWFARNPSYFVATTLVGTNVANYLTTFAIGLAAVTMFPAKAGWIEIAGAGMVDPAVFEAVGYDPEEFTGFAFGMGLERVALIRHGIDDIRLFLENDLRFTRQF